MKNNNLSDLLLNKRYPQNYIIRNPYMGALIMALFSFGFVVMYRPVSAHEGASLGYGETMAVYCTIAAASTLLFVQVLKRFRYFSNKHEWTFGREVLFILLVLTGMGVFIYFAGFFLESPVNRWNILTLLDSLLKAFLIGILPFAFFSAINFRYLLSSNLRDQKVDIEVYPEEERIQIESRLKKESLSFFPSQFLYAESAGNYVFFHLMENEKLVKRNIRNSITSIEQQLSEVPWFFRTHRAYIVNLRKIEKKHGNASGYRLKLKGTDVKIPVSRQNIRDFDKKIKRIHP